jgi:hypothetical protein
VSLPFKLCERRRRIARIVFLKKTPAVPLGLAGTARRGGDGGSLGDKTADVSGQTFQISSLLRQRLLPILDDRAMPGQDAFGLHQRKLLHHRQPSQNAAVEDRYVLRHHQVAGEQAASVLVQDRQIIVRVCRPPSFQGQRPRSQIEVQCVFDEVSGCDLLGVATDGGVATGLSCAGGTAI